MEIKTFDPNENQNASSDTQKVDHIYAAQRESIAKMRSSLLSCFNDETGSITSRAINNITVLRIYHQIARIIKYLDLMDKLENKLYESIEYNIDNMDLKNIEGMGVLLEVQAKLQKSMIESHKLLQPYMDLQDMSIVDLMSVSADSTATDIGMTLLPPESRDRIRMSAQNLLEELRAGGESG